MERQMYMGLALLVILGCAKTKEVGKEAFWELSPVASRGVSVVQVETQGPYLLADLEGLGSERRFIAPATEVCARVLAPDAAVTYSKHGTFGHFTREGEECDPVGIGSLAAWRDDRPRARGRPLPRETARFALFHRGENVVMVRGRFPFTGRVGISAGYDLVALLPNSEVCQRPIERGEAAIEFRDAGDEPFRLIGSDGTCPIHGFAAPVEL
jgi:hypothetical protein